MVADCNPFTSALGNHAEQVMLASIFGYAPEKGYAIACVVDAQGRAILMTGPYDEVRLKQDQVHAFGADPNMPECKGSMTAVIEPAC